MVYVLFVLGFLLLIKGADMLVDGASALAKRFSLSDLVIGLTIVAFGTSAPELVVNLVSSISGNSGLVLGNVLGSNIANILLVLGISATIYPLLIAKKTFFIEIPFSILAILLFGVLINDTFTHGADLSVLTRIDGMVLLLFFALFMCYIFYIAQKKQTILADVDIKPMSMVKTIGFIVVGLLGLAVGGERIVDGAVKLSNVLGISQSAIGLSIVALGTSLPELATSVVAVMKQKTDIAIGNVIGSNIFNVLRVLGISAIISPISIGMYTNRDIGFVLLISCILFVLILFGKKFVIQRYQGWILVLLYVLYMGIVFLYAI